MDKSQVIRRSRILWILGAVFVFCWVISQSGCEDRNDPFAARNITQFQREQGRGHYVNPNQRGSGGPRDRSGRHMSGDW